MSRSARARPLDVLLDLTARPVIGHRGASAHAPENTLESFRLAVESGADAIECDVHATADGVAVVMHDPTLERTTNARGAIAALSLDRVRAADAGARFTADGGRTFPFRGRGVRVPTLSELLEEVRDLPFVIELKTPAAQEPVKRVLLEHGAADRCIVAAGDPAALAVFREPPFVCGAASDDIQQLRFPVPFGRPRLPLRYRALFVPQRYYGLPITTRGFIEAARANECPVHVWTVDSAADARSLWARGACGMITNRPREMLAVRDER